jgi:uncharacterized protein (DUF2062 family)
MTTTWLIPVTVPRTGWVDGGTNPVLIPILMVCTWEQGKLATKVITGVIGNTIL